MGDCVVSTMFNDSSATLCFGLLFLQTKTPTIRRAVPSGSTRRTRTETTVKARIRRVALGDSEDPSLQDKFDPKSAAKIQ